MKQIEVVAAIIRKGDKIFATQRGYGEWKDRWEFPGGKMEAGEICSLYAKYVIILEICKLFSGNLVNEKEMFHVVALFPSSPTLKWWL